jgi:hypothetical protein
VVSLNATFEVSLHICEVLMRGRKGGRIQEWDGVGMVLWCEGEEGGGRQRVRGRQGRRACMCVCLLV